MMYSEVIFEGALLTWIWLFNSVIRSTKPRSGVDQVHIFISSVILQCRRRQFVVRRKGTHTIRFCKVNKCKPCVHSIFWKEGVCYFHGNAEKKLCKKCKRSPLQGIVDCAGLAIKMVSMKKKKVGVLCVKLENLRRLGADVIFVFNE